MTRTFACASCVPGCTLATDEDEIERPTACPWPGENAPAWRGTEAAKDGMAGEGPAIGV